MTAIPIRSAFERIENRELTQGECEIPLVPKEKVEMNYGSEKAMEISDMTGRIALP